METCEHITQTSRAQAHHLHRVHYGFVIAFLKETADSDCILRVDERIYTQTYSRGLIAEWPTGHRPIKRLQRHAKHHISNFSLNSAKLLFKGWLYVTQWRCLLVCSNEMLRLNGSKSVSM